MTESKGEWCEEEREAEQLVNRDCPDLTSGDTCPLPSNFMTYRGKYTLFIIKVMGSSP